MNYKHYSILLVLGMIVVAVVWDAVLACMGKLDGNSWCQAVRELTQQSDGLLMWLAIAVGIHIWCVQWFPNAWRHP